MRSYDGDWHGAGPCQMTIGIPADHRILGPPVNARIIARCTGETATSDNKCFFFPLATQLQTLVIGPLCDAGELPGKTSRSKQDLAGFH
jgi:hypothetical protein